MDAKVNGHQVGKTSPAHGSVTSVVPEGGAKAAVAEYLALGRQAADAEADSARECLGLSRLEQQQQSELN